MMERNYVESSNLASVGFDSEQSILEVEFKNSGTIWQYSDVEDSVYYELMEAESIGSYFYHNIRNGGYSASQVG